MSQFDLAIRGGTIVTASDEFRADIGIRDGRIVSIADRIEGAAKEIDATGLLALPGGMAVSTATSIFRRSPGLMS